MTSSTTGRLITEQEYLQLEEKSQVRHEFVNGKLFEMPGGTMFHEKIIMNLLRFFLQNTPYEIFAQGLRVRPPLTQNYYYPDVLITNEQVIEAHYAEAPLLIAEVLSPSTRLNDLVDKFIAYRQFSSLRYYLLVESKFCQVTLFYKNQNGDWESEVFHQPDDIISMERLNTELMLSAIYAGIEWTKR